MVQGLLAMHDYLDYLTATGFRPSITIYVHQSSEDLEQLVKGAPIPYAERVRILTDIAAYARFRLRT